MPFAIPFGFRFEPPKHSKIDQCLDPSDQELSISLNCGHCPALTFGYRPFPKQVVVKSGTDPTQICDEALDIRFTSISCPTSPLSLSLAEAPKARPTSLAMATTTRPRLVTACKAFRFQSYSQNDPRP